MRIATELQKSFPQFSLEVIKDVVTAEGSTGASAAKLIDMETFRIEQLSPVVNVPEPEAPQVVLDVKPIAQPQLPSIPPPPAQEEDYLWNKEKQPTPYDSLHTAAGPTVVVEAGSPPPSSVLSIANKGIKSVESYSDLSSPAVDLLLRGFGGREKHAPEKSSDMTKVEHKQQPVAPTEKKVAPEKKAVLEEKAVPKVPSKAKSNLEVTPAESYSDLTSPAVDRLLRGFGGREKYAPEKTVPLPSTPSMSVESLINDQEPGDKTLQDLAARKEARRRARRERRERQQQQREALARAAMQEGKSEDRSSESQRRQRSGATGGPEHDQTHLTAHSQKDRFLPSQSTPALHLLDQQKPQPVTALIEESDRTRKKSSGSRFDYPEEIDNFPQPAAVVRNGASSGYDTGNDYHDGTDARPKESSTEQSQKRSDKRAGKYTCTPKYSESSKGSKSKPARYESRKSKRYNQRRKTLNYDHYTTDTQDRTSF